MIYLDLFLTFLMIGAVSFGGGYGMIPLVREQVIAHGWMTEERFIDFIAVAESTPGPIAINMATFIGSTQGGVLGAALATLGVVLPAFLIILTIVIVLKNLLKYKPVQAALSSIHPATAALILMTATTLLLTVFFGFKTVGNAISFNWQALVIMAVLCGIGIIFKVKKKKFPPILMILISACLGIGLNLLTAM